MEVGKFPREALSVIYLTPRGFVSGTSWPLTMKGRFHLPKTNGGLEAPFSFLFSPSGAGRGPSGPLGFRGISRGGLAGVLRTSAPSASTPALRAYGPKSRRRVILL
jgi:hypothetical protein